MCIQLLLGQVRWHFGKGQKTSIVRQYEKAQVAQKGWSEGQCIKQGDEDQESLAKYLIISEFLIGSKKVRNSPFVLWHIPGEGGEYRMPLVSTLGRWKAANAPRLSSICGLEWRGEKAQGRRNSSLLLSFRFRLPCKVSGLPSPPHTTLHCSLSWPSNRKYFHFFEVVYCSQDGKFLESRELFLTTRITPGTW